MRKATSRPVLLSAAALALSAGFSVWCGPRAGAAPGVPAAAPAAPAIPAAAVSTDAPVRVAIANPAHIFNDMAETKALQAEMQEEQKKFAAAQHEKVAAIEDLKGKRDQLNPEHPQWAELNTQLATLTAEYKVWVEVQRAKAESTQKQKMKALFQKIEDAVGEVAKRDRIDLVIADNRDPLPTNLEDIDVRAFRSLILQRDVLYAGSRTDISQAVVTLLDARYRAAAAVPASGVIPGNAAGPYVPNVPNVPNVSRP